MGLGVYSDDKAKKEAEKAEKKKRTGDKPQKKAVGSACPYNETGYLTDKTDTYFGEALAVVQAGGNGTIEMIATDGKRTGKAAVTVD